MLVAFLLTYFIFIASASIYASVKYLFNRIYKYDILHILEDIYMLHC